MQFNIEDELEVALGIISNVGGGDWKNESLEWRIAAAKWRDRYLAILRDRRKNEQAPLNK